MTSKDKNISFGRGIANAEVTKKKRDAAKEVSTTSTTSVKRTTAKRPGSRRSNGLATVTMYLDTATHNALRHASVDLNRSMSDICRALTTDWLKAYQNGEIVIEDESEDESED